MNKLFLAICFSAFIAITSHAKITVVTDKSQLPQRQQLQQSVPEPIEVSIDEMGEFLADRLERTLVVDKDKVSTKSTHVQPSDQALKANAEANKSTFQKIYEQALKRVDTKAAEQHPDINFALPKNHSATSHHKQKSNISLIKTELPVGGIKVSVPAQEHIPYLMTNIEVLPEGVIKFSETIMVVANGRKLRHGLTRVLPEYIYSRDGKRKKIDYTLIEVSANGEKLPYKIGAGQNLLFLTADPPIALDPGIYTYKFEYLADNLLWKHNDFYELYWDITGSVWNLPIARSGATLALPQGLSPVSQTVLVGRPQQLSDKDATIIHPSSQTWGYASKRPLSIGESIYLITTIPDHKVLNASFGKQLIRNFNTYNDIYISFVTLLAILISFLISWKYIKENKGQLKISLKKTPHLVRLLAFNRYDIKSFGGFILELYRKNIIDIQQADETVLLVKRTDNLKSLTNKEQKAMNFLFTQNEPVLNVNKNNRLKVIRAARVIEKELRNNIWKFLLKLNSGYLLFSIGMLLLGEIFIALSTLNPVFTFAILGTGSICGILGTLLLYKRSYSRITSICLKVLGLGFVLLAGALMYSIVSPWSILFICQQSLL
ncbi:MAG: DUF2207 domain-containing protein [Alphaproteobacteria bacterium]|nr:DUF2207 domain-containing protein [Alphaproteobacteria bacterium]